MDAVTTTDAPAARASAAKHDVVCRLRRIEGQVRGLERMVDEDRACTAVLDQIAAVTAALQAVGLALVDDHLHRCIPRDVDDAGDEAVHLATTAVARLLKI